MRMGSRFEDVLFARVQNVAPNLAAGSSSYFSKPTSDFDPKLIDPRTHKVLPEIRQAVLDRLYGFWDTKYAYPQLWSTVWIAGSGITHQWSAARGGLGDLDILIGVDFPEFYRHNPRYRGTPEPDMAAHFNDQFRAELMPHTANWLGYETTFFVNSNSADIRNINPYAAYDLSHDEWSVRPIELPDNWDPVMDMPPTWWAAIEAERMRAEHILGDFNRLKDEANTATSLPQRVNKLAALHDVVKQGASLFSSIHTDRRKAFSGGGAGYKDYFNFRWQAHKRSGVVPALHTLATLDAESHQEHDTNTYGFVVTDAHHAATAAGLRGSM